MNFYLSLTINNFSQIPFVGRYSVFTRLLPIIYAIGYGLKWADPPKIQYVISGCGMKIRRNENKRYIDKRAVARQAIF